MSSWWNLFRHSHMSSNTSKIRKIQLQMYHRKCMFFLTLWILDSKDLSMWKNYTIMILISVIFVSNMNLKQLMDFLGTMNFLFKDKILFVSNCLMHELLASEAHGGRLLWHFGITKTIEVLYEHFYWPNIKRDA